MTNIKTLRRAERLEKLFSRLAYVSLAADIGISAVTLASMNSNRSNLQGVMTILNYSLTAIVLASVTVFALLMGLRHYEKVINYGVGINRKFQWRFRKRIL
jgi:hypothetical protein